MSTIPQPVRLSLLEGHAIDLRHEEPGNSRSSELKSSANKALLIFIIKGRS